MDIPKSGKPSAACFEATNVQKQRKFLRFALYHRAWHGYVLGSQVAEPYRNGIIHCLEMSHGESFPGRIEQSFAFELRFLFYYHWQRRRCNSVFLRNVHLPLPAVQTLKDFELVWQRQPLPFRRTHYESAVMHCCFPKWRWPHNTDDADETDKKKRRGELMRTWLVVVTRTAALTPRRCMHKRCGAAADGWAIWWRLASAMPVLQYTKLRWIDFKNEPESADQVRSTEKFTILKFV